MVCTRSTVEFSGITNSMSRPYCLATMAKPIPVLPLVASINFDPVLKSPRSSPFLMMERAGRSLTLPPGLFPSNLKNSSTLGLGLSAMERTKGVLPIKSNRVLDIGQGLYLDFGFVEDCGIWGHRSRDPGISPDDRVFPDHGLPSQNGGIGIDCNVAHNGRVPLCPFQVFGHVKRTQGDPLIYFHIVMYYGGFLNDHSGRMVDKEGFYDFRHWIVIHPGLPMSVFGHQPRDKGQSADIEFMGQAINGNGIEPGVGHIDFLNGQGSGVAIQDRL